MTNKMIALLMAAIFTLAGNSNGAQAASNSNWRVHPLFAAPVQNIIDTGDMVYYMVSNNLYRYYKDTQENEHLSTANYLNDVGIAGVYYNYYKNYLMVVYDNSNIDVLLANGDVVNMPEILNSTLNVSKGVNHVTFTAARAYVATQFGYVVINDSKWEVDESHIYNENVNSVAVMGDWILLTTGGKLHYAPEDGYYDSLSKWQVASNSVGNGLLFPITDNSVVVNTGWTVLLTATAHGGQLAFEQSTINRYATGTLQPTPSGWLGNSSNAELYYTLDFDGGSYSEVASAEKVATHDDGDGTLWAVSEKGLRSMADSATYHRPNALTTSTPFHLAYNSSQQKLFVTSTGTNRQIDAQRLATAVNSWDGSTWTDVTPTGAEFAKGGTYGTIFSKSDPNTYFMNSWWNGLYRVTNGVVTANYNGDNSPLEHMLNGYYSHSTIGQDRYGNLWALLTSPSVSTNNLFVLPASMQDKATPEASDWRQVTLAQATGTKWGQFLFCNRSNVGIYSDGSYGGRLTFFSTSENPSGTLTSRSYTDGTVSDQDNLRFSWTNITALAEDNNGDVWMGCTSGVVAFSPADGLGSNFTINHLKVPRNDGTNLADYLLSGIRVDAICVDASNRKWLGTNGSGLYLVNADGSEVLQEFNTSNSPLLSNNIYDLCLSPDGNTLYVTMQGGMMEYSIVGGGGTVVTSDNVLAYPNPVRPEYSGSVTIVGLSDNALVKIADAGGNVVRTFKSTGGSATWDTCDFQGDRVKSGVYFVISSNADTNGDSENVVTKILIMR